VQVWLSGTLIVEDMARRPALLVSSYSAFSHGRTPSEESLAEQGRAIGRLLFPSTSAARVQQLLTERQAGDRVNVVIEAATELLGLPFETTRLPVPGVPDTDRVRGPDHAAALTAPSGPARASPTGAAQSPRRDRRPGRGQDRVIGSGH
jgi:hypothetical protein